MAGFVSQYPGEIAALAASFCWACAAVLFSLAGRGLSPVALNFAKGVLACAALFITLLLSGGWGEQLAPQARNLLFISGFLGIAVGDTAYFICLRDLGPRKALLLFQLAPPLAALMGLFFLGERLPLTAWLGIAVTMLGIGWVILAREGSGDSRIKHPIRGLAMGVFAALMQATGAVLSREAFLVSEVTPLYSALLRQFAGTAPLLFALAWIARRRSDNQAPQLPTISRSRLWMVTVTATMLGTYAGIWLLQVALKHTSAGVTQTIVATSPLFVLPIVALQGEKIDARAVVGALIALLGVAMLFGLFG